MPENTNNKWTREEDARFKSMIEANTSATFGVMRALDRHVEPCSIPIATTRIGGSGSWRGTDDENDRRLGFVQFDFRIGGFDRRRKF